MMAPVLVITAPGKVIVHGEHAVVYGKKALAAGLDLRTTLKLTNSDDGFISVNLPNINTKIRWCCEELEKTFTLPLADARFPVEASSELHSALLKYVNIESETKDTKELALVAFLYLFGCLAPKNGKLHGLSIEICSDLPTSAGLGSSAAFSVCLASALLSSSEFIHLPADASTWSPSDLELINKWAFMAEKIIHGRPSGIDNSISTYGCAIWYSGGEITPVDWIPSFRILLVNTKISRSTKVLVEKVKQKHEKYPEIVKPVLDSIEAIVHECDKTLHQIHTDSISDSTRYQTLGELIDMNQQLLTFLGVSHPALDQLCLIFRKYGLSSKLTGAGGGGCAFALIPPDFPCDSIKLAIEEITSAGFDCFETNLGGSGVVAKYET